MRPFSIPMAIAFGTMIAVAFGENVGADLPACDVKVLYRNPPQEDPRSFGRLPNPDQRSDAFGLEPRGLIVDDRGSVFVADQHKYRIVVIDAKGNWVRSFPLQPPSKPHKPGTHWIHAMAWDPEGNLNVVNEREYRVEVYRPTGDLVRVMNYAGDVLFRMIDGKMRARYYPRAIGTNGRGEVFLYSADGEGGGGVYSKDGALLRTNIARAADKGAPADAWRFSEDIFVRRSPVSLRVPDEGFGRVIGVLDSRDGSERFCRLPKDLAPAEFEWAGAYYVHAFDSQGDIIVLNSTNLDLVRIRIPRE